MSRYDIDENHINKAKRRASELKVPNIQFYVAGYENLDDVPSADLLYTKMSLVGECNNSSSKRKFIETVCKGVKRGGKYIMAVEDDCNITSMAQFLEQEGIIFEDTTILQLPRNGWKAFNYCFHKR